MSSKHQRDDSSKPSTPYDRKKFISEATSDPFHTVLPGKVLIPERSLRPHETQDGSMAAMILERGWLDFIAQPEATIVSVVKEFYANAKETQNHVVLVRGKAVSSDKASINTYYNIEDMSDDDEFTKYRHEDLDLD